MPCVQTHVSSSSSYDTLAYDKTHDKPMIRPGRAPILPPFFVILPQFVTYTCP